VGDGDGEKEGISYRALRIVVIVVVAWLSRWS
jgi:hypothetical protein